MAEFSITHLRDVKATALIWRWREEEQKLQDV